MHDRVDLARRLGASQSSDGAFHLPTNPSAFYLVNPTGDLHKTQDRFTSYLTHARTPRWTGILGRPPVADEFLSALSRDDIVLRYPCLMQEGSSCISLVPRSTASWVSAIVKVVRNTSAKGTMENGTRFVYSITRVSLSFLQHSRWLICVLSHPSSSSCICEPMRWILDVLPSSNSVLDFS